MVERLLLELAFRDIRPFSRVACATLREAGPRLHGARRCFTLASLSSYSGAPDVGDDLGAHRPEAACLVWRREPRRSIGGLIHGS